MIPMPEHGQLFLALLVGIGFGFFVARLGSSWQRLAVMLVALWALNPLAQQIYGGLRGHDDTMQDIVRVGSLWLIFTIGAVVSLAIINRREVHDGI